jgi:hypothetical protein
MGRTNTPEQRRINAGYKSYIYNAQKVIEEEEEKKWRKRWE